MWWLFSLTAVLAAQLAGCLAGWLACKLIEEIYVYTHTHANIFDVVLVVIDIIIASLKQTEKVCQTFYINIQQYFPLVRILVVIGACLFAGKRKTKSSPICSSHTFAHLHTYKRESLHLRACNIEYIFDILLFTQNTNTQKRQSCRANIFFINLVEIFVDRKYNGKIKR